jgi:crotonobetainyl-CoA:carnitine CoA-transferase CaiB-like acyl-CoA transferase
LGYEKLSALKSDIIVCDISGYGDDPVSPGPYRDKKAYDLLIQSEAGFVSVTGTADEPCKAGPSIADIAAGMYAYSNILAALMQRAQTGKGQRIDVSMLESLAEWTSYPLYYAFEGQPPPPRTGAAHATIYPYGPFPTGDGGTVMMGLQNEREWAKFCEVVLLQPALTTDPRFTGNAKRVAARDALRAIIVKAFSGLTAPQVVERLEKAQIANARVNSMHEVWEHPQLKARGRWREVGTPAGPVPAMLPPGTWDTGPRMDPVPALGEHTDAILRELGIDAKGIAALRSAEAV